MNKFIYISIFISALAISCSEEKKDEGKENKNQSEEVKDGDTLAAQAVDAPLKVQIDDYVFSIDTSLTYLNKLNSLPFTNVKEDKR